MYINMQYTTNVAFDLQPWIEKVEDGWMDWWINPQVQKFNSRSTRKGWELLTFLMLIIDSSLSKRKPG